MAKNPAGADVTWVAAQPSQGCCVCRTHRRGTNESKSNGTTGYVKFRGTGQAVCGDCAQLIKAVAP